MKTLAIFSNHSEKPALRALAVIGFALAFSALLIASCTTSEEATPTVQPQPTATTVPAPTNTPAPPPTVTPAPQPTATTVPTATAIPATPIPTATATPTATPTPSPTPVPTVTPTPTEIPEPLFTLLLLATGGVGSNDFTPLEPGDTTLFDRDFPGAPPGVPHSLSDLDIDLNGNDCMMCHERGFTMSEGHIAIKIPETHYTDLSTGLVSEELNLRRYVCTSCHVPQALESLPYADQ